ncbi:MAG: hypothetical protein ACK40X_13325 [Armatimonadota bacterium]
MADEGRLLLLEPDGDAFRLAKVLDHLGLGKRVRFALDGAWLLVSDTDRHRLIWLDWTEWKILGFFGETDKPGDDLWHLREPTLVALWGNRAVVADSSNQRIVKLQLLTSR